MIRPTDDRDVQQIWTIINDGAQAYKGIIPPDRWKEPYMSREELDRQIAESVLFWAFDAEGEMAGVMGIQKVADFTLIRHAYVRSRSQKLGIGGKLLAHLRTRTDDPVLIGTWADAHWAIHFYQRHGFELVSCEEKDRLLRRYWNIPERQAETSVVLADEKWRQSHQLSAVGE